MSLDLHRTTQHTHAHTHSHTYTCTLKSRIKHSIGDKSLRYCATYVKSYYKTLIVQTA